jgi:hypothetical protein
MVSTYLTYNSVARNLQQSLTRVAQQPAVTGDAAYYRDNIGKVKTVDDFLKNDRLYRYAMKAYGLEDMTYAKAFMKKVLTSDLSDSKSFANKLTDKRYAEFAAAFTFTGSAAVVQTTHQTDDMVDLYTASIKQQVDAVDEDTRYYNAVIGTVQNVDELLKNDRLRTYVFSAIGIDDDHWSYDTIKGALTSDPADPNSVINTVWGPRLADTNASLTQAQADVSDATTQIAAYRAQLTDPGADIPDLTAKIATQQSRLTKSNSLVTLYRDSVTAIGQYFDLANAFDFSADGTLPAGTPAQTDQNRLVTNQLFVSSKAATYSDESNEDLAIKAFRGNVYSVTSIDKFISTPSVFDFALKAVGLDPDKVSAATIRAVFKSDLADPHSAVYALKDDRFVQLAHAFNFDSKGNLTTPLVAQDAAVVTDIAKDYITGKLKVASAADKASVQAKAETDAVDYKEAVAGVGSISELLANRKIIDFVLVAKGLDPKTVTTDYLKKVLSSDLNNPKSFANTASDPRFADIAASFNFDTKGNVARFVTGGPQTRDRLLETQHNYLEQSLEAQQGDANPGVRLALYFQRKAPNITSAYDILADKALAEVFRTAFNMPDAMASTPIDQQAKVIDKNLKVADLSDPAKLQKLLARFTVMYDLKNGSQDSSAPGLVILNGAGAGGVTSISQDTFLAIAKLGR